MTGIVISYRRSDTAAIVGRVADRLRAQFGADQVFLDVDTIPLGANYRAHVEQRIRECDILLVFIGERWIDANCEDPVGVEVQLEIATAIKHDRCIIPVVVGTASMPQSDELPPEIRELARRNAALLQTGALFETQFAVLLKGIEQATKRKGATLSTTAQPVTQGAIRNYSIWFAEEMSRLSGIGPTRGHYVDAHGADVSPATGADEYGIQIDREQVLTPIRRAVKLLSASSHKDNTTAELAELGRADRLVPSISDELKKVGSPLVLLGDPGTGKSVALREVGRDIAQRASQARTPTVVVYVRLGLYTSWHDDGPGDVMALVRDAVPDEHAQVRGLLDDLADQRRLVLLFDGMDEMERKHYRARVQELSAFARKNVGRIKTLFACRIDDFTPDFEHRQLVLLPFDRGQVKEFILRNLPSGVVIEGTHLTARAVFRSVIRSPELWKLSRTPLMTFLLCRFLQEEHRWPGSAADLFDKHVARGVAHVVAQRERDGLDPLDREALRADWAALAFQMSADDAGTHVKRDDFRSPPNQLTSDASLSGGLASKVLAVDPDRPDSVRFAHHQLQEYLAAEHIARAGAQVDWNAVVDSPRWHEILLQMASLGVPDEAYAVFIASCRAVSMVLDEKTAPSSAMQQSLKEAARDIQRANARGDLVEQASALTERLVLGMKLVGIAKRRGKLQEDLTKALNEAVPAFATVGFPTTQIRLLVGARTFPDTALFKKLVDIALLSDVNWVRDQGVVVLAGLDFDRQPPGREFGVAMALNFARGDLFVRLPNYWRAALRWRTWRAVVLSVFGALCMLTIGLVPFGLFAGVAPYLHDRLVAIGATPWLVEWPGILLPCVIIFPAGWVLWRNTRLRLTLAAMVTISVGLPLVVGAGATQKGVAAASGVALPSMLVALGGGLSSTFVVELSLVTLILMASKLLFGSPVFDSTCRRALGPTGSRYALVLGGGFLWLIWIAVAYVDEVFANGALASLARSVEDPQLFAVLSAVAFGTLIRATIQIREMRATGNASAWSLISALAPGLVFNFVLFGMFIGAWRTWESEVTRTILGGVVVLIVSGVVGYVARGQATSLLDRRRLSVMLRGLKPDEWAKLIGELPAEGQVIVLERVGRQELGLSAREFRRSLGEIQEMIRDEPAVSKYWSIVNSVDRMLKHETDGTDAEVSDSELVAS